LTFGLGIIILQGVSRRKSLAGVNIMYEWSVLFQGKILGIVEIQGLVVQNKITWH
jgi:hypothetical protein